VRRCRYTKKHSSRKIKRVRTIFFSSFPVRNNEAGEVIPDSLQAKPCVRNVNGECRRTGILWRIDSGARAAFFCTILEFIRGCIVVTWLIIRED
jgi:hypothetical protein